MKHVRIRLFLIFSFISFQVIPHQDDLSRQVKKFIKEGPARSAFWGVCIQDKESGKILVTYHADNVFVPASGAKLWTTAAALDYLGPDFTFRTSLYSNGHLQGDELYGDLILYGRGDPTFDKTALVSLIEQLHEWGIRKIIGDIIVDDSYFDCPRIQPQWEVMDIQMAYGCEVSALSIDNNAFKITVVPSTSIGEVVEIECEFGCGITILNEAATVPGTQQRLSVNRSLHGNEIVVSGSLGRECGPVQFERAVFDVPLFAGSLLKRLLLECGVSIEGEVTRRASDFTSARELAYHESCPLKDIIYDINKYSNNLAAELLLHTLGHPFGKIVMPGGKTTREKGASIIKKFARRFGVQENEISLADGSGLTKHTFISPFCMVNLLSYIQKHSYKTDFFESLPLAGIDGTLCTRYIDTFGQANIRAKTGMMGSVQSLSGYAQAQSGKNVVFSIMVNNHIAATSIMRQQIDELLLSLLAAL